MLKALIVAIYAVVITISSQDGSNVKLHWDNVVGQHFEHETRQCITINTWFYEADTLDITYSGNCIVTIKINGIEVFRDTGIPFVRKSEKIIIRLEKISN